MSKAIRKLIDTEKLRPTVIEWEGAKLRVFLGAKGDWNGTRSVYNDAGSHQVVNMPAMVTAVGPAFTTRLRVDILGNVFGSPSVALEWMRSGMLEQHDVERAAVELGVADEEKVAEPPTTRAAHKWEDGESFSTERHDFVTCGGGFVIRQPHVASPRYVLDSERERKSIRIFAGGHTIGLVETHRGAFDMLDQSARPSTTKRGVVEWSHPDYGETITPLLFGRFDVRGVPAAHLKEALRVVTKGQKSKRAFVEACEREAAQWLIVRGEDVDGVAVAIACYDPPKVEEKAA